MGLTKSSTGTKLLEDDFNNFKNDDGYTIALAGNPNVGKSTIFNSLTGMHQHTGNWPGKTVANTTGKCNYKNSDFLFVDIPGTYSIMSNSEEEEIARDYICFGEPDATVVVVDATCLERNLNLVFQIMEITDKVVLCVNLLDEAKKKKIKIDLELLSKELGIPVVGTIARNKKTLNNLMDTVTKVCNKKLIPHPKKIKYSSGIEDGIKKLEETLKNSFTLPDNLYRWISLKIIDGEEKILSTIESNLSISIVDNSNIQNTKNSIQNDLNQKNITNETFKDHIVSSIMKKAEKVCNKVCCFENENYSRKR